MSTSTTPDVMTMTERERLLRSVLDHTPGPSSAAHKAATCRSEELIDSIRVTPESVGIVFKTKYGRNVGARRIVMLAQSDDNTQWLVTYQHTLAVPEGNDVDDLVPRYLPQATREIRSGVAGPATRPVPSYITGTRDIASYPIEYRVTDSSGTLIATFHDDAYALPFARQYKMAVHQHQGPATPVLIDDNIGRVDPVKDDSNWDDDNDWDGDDD